MQDDINGELDNIFGMSGGNQIPSGLQKAVMMMVSGSMPGDLITGDEVKFHEGSDIMLPHGMTYDRAFDVLRRLQEEQETVTAFDQRFMYRPDDGAVATTKVLKERYGITFGKEISMGPFDTIPARTRSVKTGVNTTVQVAWGSIAIPTMPDVELMLCDRHSDDEYGSIFDIHVQAPRKHKVEIEAIFAAIELELKTNSIYRGKALSGSNKLEFIDVESFNGDEIVFADDVTEQLEAGVWSVLRYTDAFREEGLRTKRTSLLWGPYGTGKSSAGLITAQIAVQNGWTFLAAKPGEDDIDDVLATAMLYQPAVVFIEDVDTKTSTSDDDEVSELLDAFDGITAKGGELVVVMTTNHKERIHKGMFRPGRLDFTIEINCLDRNSIERLVKVVVPVGKLDNTVDFDEVYAAMDGFYPAFVREAVERAKTFAVSRGKGVRTYTLDTSDLVKAAHSLRPQLDELNAAAEGEAKPDLTVALGDIVLKGAQQGMHGARLDDDHRGQVFRVPALNGQSHS